MPSLNEKKFNDGKILLEPCKSYVIVYKEFVTIPGAHCAIVFPRNTILRAGATIESGIWSAGHEGRGTGVLRTGPVPVLLHKGARIAQLILVKVKPGSGTYDGIFADEKATFFANVNISGKYKDKVVSCSYFRNDGQGITVFDLPPKTSLDQARIISVIKILRSTLSRNIVIYCDQETRDLVENPVSSLAKTCRKLMKGRNVIFRRMK